MSSYGGHCQWLRNCPLKLSEPTPTTKSLPVPATCLLGVPPMKPLGVCTPEISFTIGALHGSSSAVTNPTNQIEGCVNADLCRATPDAMRAWQVGEMAHVSG